MQEQVQVVSWTLLEPDSVGNQAGTLHAPEVTPIELPLRDMRLRPLRDLRISVMDRCNFRCIYCMPKEVFGKGYAFLPRRELLSFEEIERIACVFVGLGVEKIRLTGGEPLLRKDLEYLVELLAGLRTPRGDAVELTLTTNGSLLSRKAQSLRDAGLKRITVSLDSICSRQGQHGGQARRERHTDSAHGRPLPGDRRGSPFHRVHGRRYEQWLEHGVGCRHPKLFAALMQHSATNRRHLERLTAFLRRLHAAAVVG